MGFMGFVGFVGFVGFIGFIGLIVGFIIGFVGFIGFREKSRTVSKAQGSPVLPFAFFLFRVEGLGFHFSKTWFLHFFRLGCPVLPFFPFLGV